MNKRNDSKVIGEVGEIFVAYLILKTRNWLARLQQMDYGVDIEAELSDPAPNGKLIKVQVKSTDSIDIKEKQVQYREQKEYIKKFLEYAIPVIFVIADTKNERAYYVYLQEWAERNKEELNNTDQTSIVIKIPLIRELHHGLNSYLKTVAKHQTWVTYKKSIERAIEFFTIKNDDERAKDLTQVLAEEGNEFYRVLIPIDDILNKASGLGNNLRGTLEGNTVQDTLYSICREYGDYFTIEDIHRMVFRDEKISMAGLNALRILYDNYPEHMRTINFAKHVKGLNIDLYYGIYYYCKLREKFTDKSDIHFASKELQTEIDGYILDDYFYEEFSSKYPNRGTIFIIQCVRPIDIPEDGYILWH
ncbi:hypothetical protein UM89_13880 [Bacillus subtilis]|nr:hypothetical protein UM89_13880 [Bacillus subtilis]